MYISHEQGWPRHLETTCEIRYIYEEESESSSGGPGRSKQLEILPNLNSKQAACLSSPACFSSSASFSANSGFSPGVGISTPQGFYRPPDFLWPQGFYHPLDFQQLQGFYHPLDFYWPQAFVHIFKCLYFLIIFLAFFIKYAPIFNRR
jgi:hypothetical protein